MNFQLIPFFGGALQAQAVKDVVNCNDVTRPFGLMLTQAQAVELVATRSDSLRDTGRVEFGGGIIDKLIREFCDSPYLSEYNYTQTLHELIELFYYFKNKSMDLMSDDDLIRYMKRSFDGVCQGSLDLLSGRELERMAKNLRFGLPCSDGADDDKEEDRDE